MRDPGVALWHLDVETLPGQHPLWASGADAPTAGASPTCAPKVMIPQVSPLALTWEQIISCHFSAPTNKARDSSASLRSTGPVSGVPDPETLAFPQVFIVLLSGLDRGQISEETLFLPDPLQKQN